MYDARRTKKDNMIFNFWDTPTGRAMQGLPPLTPPLWKPVYQQAGAIAEPNNTGGLAIQPISRQYLLSIASAYYLAGVYGATVTDQPFEGAGGPEISSATEYLLNWVDNSSGKPEPFFVNAGVLAYYYCPAASDAVPNPEPAQGAVFNPDIVIGECLAAIAFARNDAIRKAAAATR